MMNQSIRIERRSHKSLEQLGLALGLLLMGSTLLMPALRSPSTGQSLLPEGETVPVTVLFEGVPALDVSKPITLHEAQATPPAAATSQTLAADTIVSQIEAATSGELVQAPTQLSSHTAPLAAPAWRLSEESFSITAHLNRNPKHQLSFPDADLERKFTVMPSEGRILVDNDTKLALTFSVGNTGTKTASTGQLKPFEFRGKAFVNQFQMGVIQFFLN